MVSFFNTVHHRSTQRKRLAFRWWRPCELLPLQRPDWLLIIQFERPTGLEKESFLPPLALFLDLHRLWLPVWLFLGCVYGAFRCWLWSHVSFRLFSHKMETFQLLWEGEQEVTVVFQVNLWIHWLSTRICWSVWLSAGKGNRSIRWRENQWTKMLLPFSGHFFLSVKMLFFSIFTRIQVIRSSCCKFGVADHNRSKSNRFLFQPPRTASLGAHMPCTFHLAFFPIFLVAFNRATTNMSYFLWNRVFLFCVAVSMIWTGKPRTNSSQLQNEAQKPRW